MSGIRLGRAARLLVILALTLSAYSAFSQTLDSITVAQVYDPNVSTLLPTYQTRQFTATGNYSDGTQQYLTQQVTWSSADTTIATVSPIGLVTATGVGTVNITATLSGVQGSSSLTTIASTLTGVVITPAAWTMQAGTTQQFTATATLGANVIMDETQASKWASSNTSVATVSATGLVTAVAAGTATITAVYTTRKGSDVITVTSGAPPNLGQWSAPQSLGITAIHMALLNTGKVLTFEYPTGRNGGPTPARLLDPVAGTVTDVTLPWPIDIFCAGLSFLYDGRLLVSGGLDDFHYPADSGIANTTFFNPSTNTWSQGPMMNLTRWYPTTVPMPDGTILSASGTANDGVHIQFEMESYSPFTNTWTLLSNQAAWMPQPNDTYPLLTELPNGKLFYSAPRINNLGGEIYDPKAQTWTFVSNLNWGPRGHAATVLLPKSQKVMIVGGGAAKNGNGQPTPTTEIIDFSQSSPQWAYGPSMNIARYDMNVLYLADGSLIAVGGNQNSEYSNPVFQPELFNPTTQTWTLGPPQAGTRAYHSTAVLLPDGRVISAGSDAGIALENTYEIYSPPYMFAPSRPTITFSPKGIVYGKTFKITTPQAAKITRVALIRPGATTHADHMDDQYYVDLTWTVSGTTLVVNCPKTSNAIPPGYYMLVILDQNNIPSVMPFIQLT